MASAVPIVASSLSEVVPWHLHWDVLGVVLFLVVGYVYGIRRLAPVYAPRDEPAVSGRQRVLFFSGVALLGAATAWPIHDIGERSLFTFHMIEHMIMALAVPPLMLLGTPWWLLRLVVRPILPVLRVLTKPLVALVVFNTVLAFLHWTKAVELMVTSTPFHFAAHSALLASAFLMWWPVIGPIPDLPRLPPFHRMGYLFLQSLVPTIPASFLTLAEGPLYKVYEEFPRLWGWSVTSDQVIAGLIMKLGGGAVLWTAIAVTFFKWFYQEEREAAQLRRSLRTPAP